LSLFPTSFLAIQNSHDVAVFARHQAGGDLAVICINGAITVSGLVDSEQDSQQFEFGSIPVRQVKIIHVLGSAMAPNVFGVDYDIGQPVSINGDQRWQIQSVTESPDMVVGSDAQTGGAEVPAISNMIDITVIAAGDGE
jgi:hypothetical protein